MTNEQERIAIATEAAWHAAAVNIAHYLDRQDQAGASWPSSDMDRLIGEYRQARDRHFAPQE